MLLVLTIPTACHAGGVYSKVSAWWYGECCDTTASDFARELELEAAKHCALKISLYFNTCIYIELQERNGEDSLLLPLAELHERKPKLYADIAEMVQDAPEDFIAQVLDAVSLLDRKDARDLIGLLRQRVRILD